MSASAAIEVRALTKRYGPLTALEDVSCSLPAGSKTALLGENGAGKTTLLAMLSTLVTPSSGTAIIAGQDIAASTAQLRRTIGVLAHRPMLYEELSPLENLQFFARLYAVSQAAARIETLLRRIGLWRRRDDPTETLSRGFHQRLALARALLHAPAVVLADEPETGLDEDGLELLDELVLHAPGLTVLAATHRRERVDAWADGRLLLRRGRLQAAEPAALRAGTAR